jgi:hypothetical protein
MLKANVGLSRKITRDYNSSGYSVNIEGEITAPVDDAEAVVARIHELFHLAEEALQVEIDRDQGEAAIGRRDEEPQARHPANQPVPERPPQPAQPARPQQPSNHQARQGNNEPATPKQLSFISNLAKRQRLSQVQLEGIIHTALNRPCTLQQLSKRDAGAVIESLNGEGVGNGRNGGGH